MNNQMPSNLLYVRTGQGAVGFFWTTPKSTKHYDGKADGMDDLGRITRTISIGATRNEEVQAFVPVDN